MTQPDPLHWFPRTWNEIIGNRRMKRFLMKLLRATRQQMIQGKIPRLARLRFLIKGLSRTGKTLIVQFFCRCLACVRLDLDTLNPCDGSCPGCLDRPWERQNEGNFNTVEGNLRVNLVIEDSTLLGSPEDLRKKLRAYSEYDDSLLRVVAYDEIHRLTRQHMDEIFLCTMEKRRYLWFFITAKPEGLEDMFCNRVISLDTELPEPEEMGHWIIDRCNEWTLPWQPEAVNRLIEKSQRQVGIALLCLSLAVLNDDGLTDDLVDNDWNVDPNG